GHRAVLVERGLERRERIDRRAVAYVFIVLEHDRALARGHFHRDDFIVEPAGLLRRLGLVLARGGELVLVFTRDGVFLRHVLRGDAHVVLVVHVPQAV